MQGRAVQETCGCDCLKTLQGRIRPVETGIRERQLCRRGGSMIQAGDVSMAPIGLASGLTYGINACEEGD